MKSIGTFSLAVLKIIFNKAIQIVYLDSSSITDFVKKVIEVYIYITYSNLVVRLLNSYINYIAVVLLGICISR